VISALQPPVKREEEACERLLVTGVVQGVGFRPAVYRLARDLELRGLVRNTAAGVEILLAGPPTRIDAFASALHDAAPAASVIETVHRERAAAVHELAPFRIEDSDDASEGLPAFPPDLALCADCARELADPQDRRYRYPFTSCTSCGPRYSIVERLPFDRDATTMRDFPLCTPCRREYDDPSDRRFHAQAHACPDCGPRLQLTDAEGSVLAQNEEALRGAVHRLRAGRILALKGLGGYQLVVDAQNEAAVQRLRHRKGRPRKPFAVMLPSLHGVRALCRVDALEDAALQSPAAPIVLLRRRATEPPGTRPISTAVAPANPRLGVMLPCTPLHRLLADDFGGALVVTSGNRSGEPIYARNDEALAGLAPVADVFLVHDRRIARAVDDSVIQLVAGRLRVLRRARGYVPRPVILPIAAPQPILAMGAQQRCTVGLVRGRRASVSQHLGDLDSARSVAAHAAAQADLQRLPGTRAALVACDLHPDYESTRSARETGLPQAPVQHHLAHVYAAMAEHGIGPVTRLFGVAWDGTGLGSDASIWGGELFRVHGACAQRVGSLHPFRLPGGDSAIRRPWRTAVALLPEIAQASRAPASDDPLAGAPCPPQELPLLRRMLETGVRTPVTTSVGRLFDGVAVLLGLGREATFDGELAMQLQFAAERAASRGGSVRAVSPPGIVPGNPARLDWRELVASLLGARRAGASADACALAFHRGLADGLAALLRDVAGGERGPVLLTGGCFQNRLLAELCVAALQARGFTALLPERFPPNDGAIALGQLYAGLLSSAAGTVPGESPPCA
jgi:hydrogenase maturation protein HypF